MTGSALKFVRFAAGGLSERCFGIVQLIDFEEARLEHRLVELARAAILLGTRYHNWGPVPAEVRVQFLTGYESERPLTPAEAGRLDILLLWQGLAMVPTGDDPTGWGPSALSQEPGWWNADLHP